MKTLDKTEVKFIMPTISDDDTIQRSLADFYRGLGWVPEKQNLDPRKIKISESNYKAISDLYLQSDKAFEGLNMFLVSYMPSVDETLSDDIVIIHNGAFA